ncbi:something about silencing protein 10-like [Argiope bruennichi]|uniref:something about silencing protein 10-like n=1 Tax=Argiope bruennichi TaxID=94029 RepID=UPI002494DD08|nr:something about silencing protein 10-like [Argiope bruennichi]
MKSRKVKAVAKSKAFMSKKQKKGNIPLDDYNESDADVDENDLLYNERDHEDDDLSTDDELIRHDASSSEEEEVLPITDDEKEDSDEADEEEDLPSRDYWGKKKSAYYDADFVDEDRGKTYREEDAEKAALEAEEALAIQKSVYNCIKTDNFVEAFFKSAEDKSSEEKPEDTLDKEDNIKLLKKSSPELFVFIDELKEKSAELKEKISPLYAAVQDGKISDSKLSSFINNYYLILMHYCMNLSFYMAIRSKGPVMSSHPVIKSINTFKNMVDKLKDLKISHSKTLECILNKLKNNEEITLAKKKPEIKEKLPDQNGIRKKFLEISQIETAKSNLKNKKKTKEIKRKDIISEEPSDSEAEEMDVDENTMEEMQPNDPEEIVTDGKRKITYQIAKNKGLTAKRKKESRNPRVHNRMKFRKAKIRRKGQVREVIRETKRYEGEPTGISTHVVRSIKLK